MSPPPPSVGPPSFVPPTCLRAPRQSSMQHLFPRKPLNEPAVAPSSRPVLTDAAASPAVSTHLSLDPHDPPDPTFPAASPGSPPSQSPRTTPPTPRDRDRRRSSLRAPSNSDASVRRPSLLRGSLAAQDAAAALKAAIQRLYVAHIDVTTGAVDYAAMRGSSDFRAFETAVQQLPRLDVAAALHTDEARLAFWANLYNAGTQHAIVEGGAPPLNGVGRLLWTRRFAYQVGPFRLSLHDIEHGVLRANRRISIVPPPFARRDPRTALCVDHLDPRVHFVLNCAARSCPPVLFLTPDNVRGVMAQAARAFLADPGNLRVDDATVRLSLIFKWYRNDFADDYTDEQLLRYVALNGNDEQEEIIAIKRLLISQNPKLRIAWLPYDWTLNGQ